MVVMNLAVLGLTWWLVGYWAIVGTLVYSLIVPLQVQTLFIPKSIANRTGCSR
jgi:hypothetical protein